MNTLSKTHHRAMAPMPVLVAALLYLAGGGTGAVAQTATSIRALEGAWQSAVTIRDCSSGAVLNSFTGFTVFHRGGTASATNNLPPTSNGPAFGSWMRGSAPATYVVALRFFRFNPDGSFAGAQNLSRNLTLSADGSSLTGTLTAQMVDPDDVVLKTLCGGETATRVAVS